MCVENSFLMLLTARTDPKLELFVSIISCEILNLLKLSNLFKKGILSCSLEPDSKIHRRNCRKSSQHLSCFWKPYNCYGHHLNILCRFCLPLPCLPKAASGSHRLSMYVEPGTARWCGLEEALLFWVSLFQMDPILHMQSDAALENIIKSL